MHCPNCKKENADNFRYCQFCGAALTESLQLKVKEIEADALAESSVPTPETIDAWLADNNIERVSLTSPGDSTPDSPPNAGGSTGRKRVATEDLPLLDEFNATFIPVNPDSFASQTPAQGSMQSSEKRLCPNCGEIVQEGHRFCGSCGTRYDSADERSDNAAEGSDPAMPKRNIERLSFVKNRSVELDLSDKVATWTLFHVNDDGTIGERISICEGTNYIGRASSRLLSADRFVNPKHVIIQCSNSEAVIQDNESLNGVFYRLTDDSTALYDGDVFRIGEELLCFNMGNSTQPLLSTQASEKTTLLGGKEAPGWGYLRVIMGAYSEGSVYRLSQPMVSLGRTHANILFPRDGFVSGTHASLQLADDHAVLTDLNSSNGTFVRIKGSLSIASSAYILIGNQLLLIKKYYA